MARGRRKPAFGATALALLVLCSIALVIYLVRGSSAKVESRVSGVRINEVMTSNKGAVPDETGNFPDWIELYNAGSEAVNIGGYGLSDDLLTAAKWTFPSGTTIPAGGYLVVFCSGDVTRGPLHAAFKLSANDDVILSTVAGSVIDSVSLKAVAGGSTLSRDPAGAGWLEGKPSPGYPNTDEGVAAYLATLSAEAGEDIGVYINEFMASNASTLLGPDGSYCDWIELYNTTGAKVNLGGYGISDDAGQPSKYKLPEGTAIEPYGILLIYCTGRETQEPSHIEAPFGLAAYAEDVVFSNKAGKILDSYSYTRMQTDISMARIPDGTGAFAVCAQPTPGYTNNNAGLMAFTATLTYGTGALVLSEAMGANFSYLKQPDTTYPDWIELCNTGAQPLSLAGYALSNNAKNPAKWVFPDITLNAGEYLCVLATGNDVRDAQKKNSLETNFGISADGEVVFLFSPEGVILDRLQLGRARADVSYGRTGANLLYYSTPTPGAANTGGMAGYAETPKLLLASGAYEGGQRVEIENQNGVTITYTLDGSEPTQSATAYSGPITVSKTTVVRARAFTGGLYGSDIATATYVIYTGEATIKSHRHDNISIMSVVTDPKNLWDPNTGIYVLGSKYAAATGEDEDGVTMEGLMNHTSSTLANFWQSWERPAHFDLLDETGALEFSSDCIVRIFGAYSRAKEQKALSLIARAGYGPTQFEHAFFDNRPFTSYKALVLRPSAQDSTNSKIRDIVVTSLYEDGDLGLSATSEIYVQAYRQLVVYLNGSYWGVYNLREKINGTFIAQHYGLNNPDAIDILMGNGNDKCVISGDPNCWKDYSDMVTWADTHDLSDAQNYAKICSMIDVENFAAYCATEILVGNTDSGNIKYWRSEELDNKWRWLLYDFCWAFNRDDKNSDAKSSGFRRDFFSKYFHVDGHGASRATSTKLSRALLKNASFRELFLQKCAILVNEVYTEEKIIARVDACQSKIAAEMVYDVDLWNDITLDSWQRHCDNIRAYAKNYRQYFLKYAQSYFSLSDADMMRIFGAVTTLTE